MCRATWRCLTFVTGLLCALASFKEAAADALPPCWRGDTGSTVQTWRFDAGANPASPEIVSNPNGTPSAAVAVSPVGAGWLNQLFLFGTNQGVWDLGGGGSMTLTIPNEAHPAGHWKLISVQVYQFRDGSIYNQIAPVSVPGATRVGGEVRPVATNVIGPGLAVTWIVEQSLWLMEQCPASESVVISAPGATISSAIDTVIVDTICLSADDGDVFPPCWRGNAASDYQSWSFHNPSSPIAAEQTTNTLSATAAITLGPFASGWQASDPAIGCRNGFWDLGSAGQIDLGIQRNAGPPGAYSYVQVQVTQFRDTLLYNQLANVSLASTATLVSRNQQVLEPTITGEWIVDRTLWRVPNCPASEVVSIMAGPNGALIDQAVVDSVCVAYVCPSGVSLTADSGQCSRANVVWPLPVPDGCVVASATCTPSSGSTFPVGTTAVSCSVVDGLGGTLACNFNVTITDNEPPVAQCPANIMVVGNPGVCGTNVSFTATATDNCAGATISCLPPSGSVFPVGQATVTCTAVDAAGNSSTPCSFTVTVIDLSGDAVRPCWRGQPGSTYQHWAFHTSANPAAPEFSDSPGSPSATVTPGALATGWQNQPPGFGCKQGFWDLGAAGTISLDVPNTAMVGAYKYVRVQVTQFQDSLIYNQLAAVSLTPSATLVSRTQQTVETMLIGSWVVDETVWQLATCPASETVLVTAGPFSSLIDQVVIDTLCLQPPACPTDIAGIADPGQCSKAGVTWTVPTPDGCTVLSAICRTNGVPLSSPATFPVGVTAVACTVTDAEGGVFNCNFNVTITDTQPPLAVCRDITVALNALGQAVITGSQVDNGSGDNCGVASLSVAPSSFTCANAGPNLVTLTVTDVHGLTATCTATVTIQDATPPVIAVCAPSQSADAAANCQAAVPDFTAGVVASDSCGVVTITQSPAAGTLVGPGTTNVTLTVKDAANNTAICTTTFSVQALADVSVQVTSSPEPVTVGQPVSYTLLVSNAGPCEATGVTLNKVISAGQVLVSITDPGTSTARACPTPGPAAWWRAEGNADDSVGTSHGAINGGVTFVSGVVNQGFSFDGVNGYIEAPDSPALRPASLTIEGWIKIRDPNGLHVLVSKPQGGGLADSYSLWVESGVIYAAISDNAGSGQSLSYPNVPASSTFAGSDIIGFTSFANKLKVPVDPVSTFLNGELSAATLSRLAAYGGGPDGVLLRLLITDLNRIIQSGPVYTPLRFAGVTLAPETQYLLARNPTGSDLVRLNHLLVRDAYPAEIQSNVFPELNVQYHVAYTFDPVAQKQALYVNGTLVDSSFINKAITYTARPLIIGGGENAGTPDYFYQGDIDELAVYDRALTGIEVQGIHGAGANGKCFSLGAIGLGTLAAGASQTVTVVTVPTACPGVSLQATVAANETDPSPANNTSNATATVIDLPASQVVLDIRRISPNNNHVEITWPITCAPYQLETTDDLSPYPAIIWTPASVPILILQGRYSTVIPADDAQRFFRLRSP